MNYNRGRNPASYFVPAVCSEMSTSIGFEVSKAECNSPLAENLPIGAQVFMAAIR